MRGLIRTLRFYFLLAFAGLLVVLLLATPQGRRHAAKLERYVDRIEHRLFFRSGRPLRGTPVLARFENRLQEKGVKAGSPVFIRIFKQESELELWLHDGKRFVHFATYPMCYWSGSLGPKLKEGDGQSPEGFYTVAAKQLNPNSRWHRSFNLGFPNQYDRSHGRTGSYLMVHGGCASIGCYAMTNPVVEEIWQLVTAALKNDQQRFSVHAFPFRMTASNMEWYADKRWSEFWSDLKRGYDLFEKSKVPPRVSVCDARYATAPGKPGSTGSGPLETGCAIKLSSG